MRIDLILTIPSLNINIRHREQKNMLMHHITYSNSMLEQSNKIAEFINNGSHWVYKTAIAIDAEAEVAGVNPLF